MAKAQKLSPSPTYSKIESKRSKTIDKAVRQTDEDAIRQHASDNTAMKMDGTVETHRVTSETNGTETSPILPFGGNDTRSKPRSGQDTSQKSSLGESSTLIVGSKGE